MSLSDPRLKLLRASGAAPLALSAAFMFAPGMVQARSADDPAAAGIAAICRSVMHLPSGTTQYGACTDSLADTWRRIGRARADAEAHEACLAQGYAAGGQAMALCVLDRVRAAPANPQVPIPVAARDGRSYASMNFGARRSGEEASCANLGLEPGTAGFGGCVASLDASLFDADNPSH